MKWFCPVLLATIILGSPVQTNAEENSKLAVVWTSGDPDVAHRMVLMYTHAAKSNGWFDEVVLVIWGPSQRLLAGDKSIRDKVIAMKNDGVRVEACIVCSDAYELTNRLQEMGITVKPMGVPLTEMLKGAWEVITF